MVGHHLLDPLLDALYDHLISCLYQRLCFLNLPQPCDVAKPCRSVECSTLRSYASPECVAFPQITQIAACCTFGTHRIPRTCTFGVVAADSKRAAFQQLQGYITTRLKRFSGCDKIFFSRGSNDNITISALLLQQHQQAISSSSACLPDGRAFFFHSSCP